MEQRHMQMIALAGTLGCVQAFDLFCVLKGHC